MAPNTTTSSKPQNPNEHLNIPEWINGEYFQKILEENEPNFKKIISFTPIAATAPGENYTSIMVRVVIDIELKDGSITQTSYILKTVLDAGNDGAAMVESMNLFPKEKLMYQKILPDYVKYYKAAGIDIQLGPKCLHVEETPERITLVMEDLKRRNFSNVDRLKGFDMRHITRVLEKLAEMHAASAVYAELNGPFEKMFQLHFFSENNRELFEKMSDARYESYVEAMRTWGLEDVEDYIAMLPSGTEYFDESMRMNDFDPNEFNVLNHGDCWSNNIMFNYKENGEIDEALFVDFQIGKWGSPTQDLWYVITSSVSMDIKVKEFDRFIQIYHKRLVECLKMLKYSKPIPSLRELHMLMLKYGFWGPFTAMGVMVVIVYPSDKEASMDNLLKMGPEGDEFRRKTYMNPIYGKAMCQLYPFFVNKGILVKGK